MGQNGSLSSNSTPLRVTLLLLLPIIAGCTPRPRQPNEPPHLSIHAAESLLNSDNVGMLRFSREAILKEPHSPRARLLMALGLARSGNGRDAVFEVAVAQQLSRSAELAPFIQPDTAPRLATSPLKLAALLKPIISHVPY